MADSIQLSRSLVYQLADDDKSKKKTKKTKPKTFKGTQQSQKKVQHKQIPNVPQMPKGNTSPGWPLQTPFCVPPPPPSPPSLNPELETVQSVLKESKSVLEKLQAHEEIMLKKVSERAKELHEKEFKLPQQKIVICQPEKDACLACYKEHIKDPLKCAPLVGTFQDCVRKARKQMKVPS